MGTNVTKKPTLILKGLIIVTISITTTTTTTTTITTTDFGSVLFLIFVHSRTASSRSGTLIIEPSRPHSDTPTSVGLNQTGDHTEAKIPL